VVEEPLIILQGGVVGITMFMKFSELLGGGKRCWIGRLRKVGLAILPGLTHYNSSSPALAAVTIPFVGSEGTPMQ
jgi:hypothetical protein